MSFLLPSHACTDNALCPPCALEEDPLAHSRVPGFVNRNHLWCQIIADALADMGVVDVVMHPGARNVPLALAMSKMPGFRMHFHIDERSGAFMALGLAATTGAPVVVSTTAGSAVANCLPALTEANKRNLPVILISGDRHRSSRHINIPQSSDQIGTCAPLMRAQHDLPDPLDSVSDLIALRRTILDCIHLATHGLRPGPVQINLPLWGISCGMEPERNLETNWEAPVASDAAPKAIRDTVVATRPRPRVATSEEIDRATSRIIGKDRLRGLVFCGPDTCVPPTVVDRLAERTGFPVIADAASGIRKKSMTNLVTMSDALSTVDGVGALLAGTNVLIRFGGSPATPAMTQLTGFIRCPTIRIARATAGPDFWTNDAIDLRPVDMLGVDRLSHRLGQGDPAWLSAWMQMEQTLSSHRRKIVAELPWGDVRATGLACNATGYDFIHVGNSLATRITNLLAEGYDPAHREFIARGMAGTDGALGTFLGELLGTGKRGLLLIGDQSATHDLPALANSFWRQARGAIVVINNSGAGIFDTLACARVEGYRDIMRNQPMIDFRHIAAAFSLGYRRCEDAGSFRQALAEGTQTEGVLLIEAVSPPESAPRDLATLLHRPGVERITLTDWQGSTT